MIKLKASIIRRLLEELPAKAYQMQRLLSFLETVVGMRAWLESGLSSLVRLHRSVLHGVRTAHWSDLDLVGSKRTPREKHTCNIIRRPL